MKYAFVQAHRQQHTLQRLFEVLEISRSGYHAWLGRPQSHRSAENRRLTERIKQSHRQSRGIYGSPKVHEDLVSNGDACGVNRVARLMTKIRHCTKNAS